jgi:AcrR family transcriptional regulator
MASVTDRTDARPAPNARPGPDAEEGIEDLAVRPPRQERTRHQWARVLDCGIEILEQGGYEAFTIAAVCERAQVPPRALYARVSSKDGLFLAVYDHGMTRVTADHAAFADDSRWSGLAPEATIRQAVTLVLEVFARHAALLRSVVLLSSAHPEVLRRGSEHAQQLRALFVRRCAPAVGDHHPSRSAAAETAFNTVFAVGVFDVAYGRSFLGSADDQERLATDLASMQTAYLTGGTVREACVTQ